LTHCCSQDHIAASKELQHSPTFKLLLSVTLGLGNFVNHGSRLAPAGGFRLKTLNKLHDSKTPDNKQTMLQVRTVCLWECLDRGRRRGGGGVQGAQQEGGGVGGGGGGGGGV
jgi:hypothetical protein